jgi:hypothetical protein
MHRKLEGGVCTFILALGLAAFAAAQAPANATGTWELETMTSWDRSTPGQCEPDSHSQAGSCGKAHRPHGLTSGRWIGERR